MQQVGQNNVVRLKTTNTPNCNTKLQLVFLIGNNVFFMFSFRKDLISIAISVTAENQFQMPEPMYSTLTVLDYLKLKCTVHVFRLII